MVLILEVNVLTRRRPITQNSDSGRMQPDSGETVWMRIGERTQQQRVNHAEYGGIGADSNAKRGQNYHGQHYILAKHTKGNAEILQPEIHQSSRIG